MEVSLQTRGTFLGVPTECTTLGLSFSGLAVYLKLTVPLGPGKPETWSLFVRHAGV